MKFKSSHQHRRRGVSLLFLAVFGCLVFESAFAQPIIPTATNAPPGTVSQSLAGDGIVLPAVFNDPIEPFNRAMWGFNKGFLTWVARPPSKDYRRVVLKTMRTVMSWMGKSGPHQ